MVTKKHIIEEIQRTATENGGKPLGRNRFLQETGIREVDWLGRYWARWGDAVAEAGFQPNTLVERIDDDFALEQLAIEARRLGHMPTYAELRMSRQRDKDFPSTGIYERLGPKAKLAERLEAFCKEHPEFADVQELIEPLLGAEEDSEAEGVADDAEAEDGFVYLLKSGRHYKLGRTNSLGRRGYELAIQLPERATEVHAIRTDDPSGIENYWHKRFADKRKNGEWFELSAADVRAFKRRRSFM